MYITDSHVIGGVSYSRDYFGAIKSEFLKLNVGVNCYIL